MMEKTKNSQVKQPSLRELLRWLTGVTRPVHAPLYVSTVFRIINLSCDILLFAFVAGGLVKVIEKNLSLMMFFSVLIILSAVKAVAYYLEQFTGHYVAFKALELLRTHVFSQLWPKAPAFMMHSRSGDLLTSLTRDVDRIEVVYAHTFAPVISAYTVPIVMLILGGSLISWSLVLIPAVMILFALLVVPFVGLRSSLRKTHNVLTLRRDLSHYVHDSVFGVEEIVSFGCASERIEHIERMSDEIQREGRAARLSAGFRRMGNYLLMLLSVVGVGVAGVQESFSLFETMVIMGGVLRLFVGPVGVEDAAGYIDHSLAAARRLWSISHAPVRVVEGSRVCPKSDEGGAISFCDVSYSYVDDSGNALKPVLRDLSVDFPSGTHTAIVGASGSGKSTLVQLLLRFDDPCAGDITLDGISLRDLTFDSLRSSIVMVSQRGELLDSTIRENVILGCPDASDGEIWSSLDAVCLGDDVRSMPDGLDTRIGVSGSQLSGGQAQRLCLARALIMKPRVLVLDEFTSALNEELEKELRSYIKTSLPSTTIIEVTHRLQSLDYCDRVLLVDEGRIVNDGAPYEVLPHMVLSFGGKV